MARKRVSLKISAMTGTAKPVRFSKVLPINKQAKELFVVENFARIQKVGSANLTDIALSPDDSHGKADVLAKANGKQVAIQVTELKIAHRAAAVDRSRKMTSALLDATLKHVKLDYRVMVDIRSNMDYTNQSPKLVGKCLDALGVVIADGIHNSVFSPHVTEYFEKKRTDLRANPLKLPEKLQDTVTRVELMRIPEDHNTMCQGRDNLFINFNFDTVVGSDTLDEELVNGILEKKAKSVADTLLVWACDKDFWGQEEKIHEIFVKHSDHTQFENIYLYFFIDAEGMFQVNQKVFVVREKA